MTDLGKEIYVGVDTHADFHHVAILNDRGDTIADRPFESTGPGYGQLSRWAHSFGDVIAFGVEGSGSYGAALTTFLVGHGDPVQDVIATDAQERRLRGKTDAADAVQAAQTVRARLRQPVIPKDHTGIVEAIRVLQVSRTLLVRQRTQTMNEIHALLVTAPVLLRDELRGLSGQKLLARLRAMTAGDGDDVVTVSVKTSLPILAEQHRVLTKSMNAFSTEIGRLTRQRCPPTGRGQRCWA